MNNDLISREALKKALNEMFDTVEVVLFDDIIATIDNAPTVDMNTELSVAYLKGRKRPQGEWIKVKEERMSVDMSGEIATQYKCTKCGRVIATFPSKLADYYPFCQCGAKMKGGAV